MFCLKIHHTNSRQNFIISGSFSWSVSGVPELVACGSLYHLYKDPFSPIGKTDFFVSTFFVIAKSCS